MNKFTLSSTLIMSSLIIGACSSSSSDDPILDDPNNNDDITGNANQLGFIGVEDAASGSDIDLSAVFVQFSTPISASLISAGYAPVLDTCEVSDSSTIPDDEFDIPGIDTSFTSISAGESLVFTSGAGTYAELQKSIFSTFTMYTPTVESLTGPLPDSLSLNIPGDVFPAYANVPIPTLGTLELTLPAEGAPITPTTQFTWSAGSLSNAYVELNVSSVSFTNGTTTNVSCTVTDDGEFNFPTATQADMGVDFNSLFGFSAQRLVNTVLQSGTSVLIVESSSSF